MNQNHQNTTTVRTGSSTDDVAGEVVLSVDRAAPLSAVFIHDHGSEVISEQVVVGPQVQSEPPTQTNTHGTFRPVRVSRTGSFSDLS